MGIESGSHEFRVIVPGQYGYPLKDAIEKIPSAVIVSHRELDVSTAGLKEWSDELDGLQKLIDLAKKRTTLDKEIVKRGYNSLGFRLTSLHDPFPERYRTGLANNVISVFQKSLDAYREFAVRPSEQLREGHAFRYRSVKNKLSPRDIRVIIFNFGLTGKVKPDEEIQAVEGLRNTYYVKTVVGAACVHLKRCLDIPANLK